MKNSEAAQDASKGLDAGIVASKWMFVILSFLLLIGIVFARDSFRKIPGSLFVGDGFGYYIYLPSWLIDGDTDLTNQLAYQPDQPGQIWYTVVPATGRPGNCFQVGCAVLWLPFFVAAHGVILLLNNVFGYTIPVTGFGWPYELPVYIGSFFYGMLGLNYMHRLIHQNWDRRLANITVVAVSLGTGVAAYIWFEPAMSHVVSLFLISALFYYLDQILRADSLNWTRWGVIGLLVGLAAATRGPDGMVGIAALLVGLTVTIRKRPLRYGLAAVAVVSCGVGAFLGFLPQMLVWKHLYGEYLTKPPNIYPAFDWTHPDFVDYLFAVRRSLFVWTPLLLPATIGAFWGAVRGPQVMRYGAVVLGLAIYFYSCNPTWWQGASFGSRRIVDFAVLFALGLAFVLNMGIVRRLRPIPVCLILLLIGFNWLLMVRYFTLDLPEYGHVSLYDLTINTLRYPYDFFVDGPGSKLLRKIVE